jgi:EAL domain-containing protein (putative c-di-GMP-specific phosphodiesterase class I)
VATSDADNLNAEALLRDADIAMYHSKQRGRGMCTVATKEMRLAVRDRSNTKNALERAIENNELVLHYQPIVALDTSEIRAVEALVRWQHPERGLIPPTEFIPVAEDSGLINRLGEWVLHAACRQAARWRLEFCETAPLPIHVNLAARQVAQQDLFALVRDALNEHGVPPSDIVLEITESALIEGTRGPIAALVELTRMGVSIVLDDFGTGYSSLSYLERFPIDTLKIDRAFVSKIKDPAAPSPIVAAIVGMASALAVGTVAEGVETADQAAAVAALGCQHAQGYFFARPAPAERTTQLVRDNMPLPVQVA